MGQQLGAIRFKGKVANVVGFKNSASSKSNNNFVREHQSTVSNPRTYAQARQRSKAIPAQNFYAAFENVLNHAFLPTDRASRNRNRFISKAMKLDEVPDVLKGESLIPLCTYQVSEGSLGLDNLAEASTVTSNDGGVGFGLSLTSQFGGNATIAAISTDLLNENSTLVEGMELTFLVLEDCSSMEDGSERLAKVVSFVLDKSNTLTKLGDIAGNFALFVENGRLFVADNYSVLSAALIISSRAGSSWRYTNSIMGLSTKGSEVKAQTLESDVIESYMNSTANRTSDLILQQADNQQTEGVHPSSVTTMNITLAQGVTGALSANAANIVAMSNGVRKVMVLNGALTTGAAGSRVAITITPTDGTARPLTLADTTFDGNETITVEEVEAYGI